MPAPSDFIAHLAASPYHPRSNKHGIALCDAILVDLLANCSKLAEHANKGFLVYERNQKIFVDNSQWNIDLVIGTPPTPQLPPNNSPIARAVPSAIRIAIEAKTIMTEHGKARRNRQRDLESFHDFAHRHDSSTIAAAATIINIASQFQSPLRGSTTIHRNVTDLVAGSIRLFRSIQHRTSLGQRGLEANTVIVVDHENVLGRAPRLITHGPAPQLGEPLNYDSFVRRICDRYTERWG